jgi:hypothetical protein
MRKNKFRYNKENITSRLFAQNRKRRPSHYDDEEEDEEERGGGGMGAGAAMGLGAAGLGLASQGLSALGTIQGVHEQGKGVKGWFDRNKRRKEDYKKYGGDEKLMERKRDQAYRLSKTAKNSAQEAALKHRESEISDSLEWARKKNAYKADMAKQKSWVGKGTTWAKHNPMKAGLAAAGVAAAAGGAYYMWKKRQEEKKRREREKREREGGYRTRHQSKITSRLFNWTNKVGRGARGVTKNMFGGSKTKSVWNGVSGKGGSSISMYQKNKMKKTPAIGSSTNKAMGKSNPWLTGSSNNHKPTTAPVSTPKPTSHHSTSAPSLTPNKGWSGTKSPSSKPNSGSMNSNWNHSSATNKQPMSAEQIHARKQKERHQNTLNDQKKRIADLEKKTQELKTAGKGVWDDNYINTQKEMRNLKIEHHNTKFKGDKVGDFMARGGYLKKFDKNGNLRWGKKRMALAGLGAYAAYNMMKDDDDK